MVHTRRSSVRVRATLRLACALVAATALVLPGCKPPKRDGLAGRPAFDLTLDGSVRLGVDYQTGTIAASSGSPQIVLGFSTKGAKSVLTVDCSRLGGGSIAGRFQAYLGGAEVERGEFQCLYQHVREFVLKRTADAVKITDLRFIRVIE
jgi:hypothetical protein